MRRILALAFLSSLAFAPIGIGSPIDGTWGDGAKLTPAQVWQKTKTFRAGERACVVAVGDSDSAVVNMEISVFDQKGNLVANDKSTGALVGDFVCVIWYPPRDGEYRIEVRNPGTFVKNCYIAIK